MSKIIYIVEKDEGGDENGVRKILMSEELESLEAEKLLALKVISQAVADGLTHPQEVIRQIRSGCLDYWLELWDIRMNIDYMREKLIKMIKKEVRNGREEDEQRSKNAVAREVFARQYHEVSLSEVD